MSIEKRQHKPHLQQPTVPWLIFLIKCVFLRTLYISTIFISFKPLPLPLLLPVSYFSIKAAPLNLPKQQHQLRTKCSHGQTSGGHFISKTPLWPTSLIKSMRSGFSKETLFQKLRLREIVEMIHGDLWPLQVYTHACTHEHEYINTKCEHV